MAFLYNPGPWSLGEPLPWLPLPWLFWHCCLCPEPVSLLPPGTLCDFGCHLYCRCTTPGPLAPNEAPCSYATKDHPHDIIGQPTEPCQPRYRFSMGTHGPEANDGRRPRLNLSCLSTSPIPREPAPFTRDTVNQPRITHLTSGAITEPTTAPLIMG